MRIKISGDCPTAQALRGELTAAGYVVTDVFPSYTVYIEEAEARLGIITIDAIDCDLERQVINAIAERTERPIALLRAGGIQSEREIRVVVPADESYRAAVERGVLSGLARATYHRSTKPWYRRILL